MYTDLSPFPHFIYRLYFPDLFFNWCSYYALLAFLILLLIPHFNLFVRLPLNPPSTAFFSAVLPFSSSISLHNFPFSYSPSCFSSSRKKNVYLNCAISSSLGSSSAHGATLLHPQTPLGVYPGGPLSPLTGLAVMGVESICFISEKCVKVVRPVGGGKGRRRRD